MIKLKGMQDSMLRCIISEELEEGDIASSFEGVLSQGQGILPESRVVLDFGARALTRELVSSILSDFVWVSGVEVAAWITYDAESQDILKKIGLPTAEPTSTRPEGEGVPAVRPGLILDRSFRSGQKVEHRGDVIINGHVNDGAEIFATGNVTVLGRLAGLVHAGCGGDESATVVARSMETLQVRIAGKIGSLDRGAAWWGKMVVAKVEEGSVLIDYWPVIKGERVEDIA